VALETATVSRHQVGNHVPVARQQILNNATAGFYVVRAGDKVSFEFRTGGCQEISVLYGRQ
jgi:hypothetical protein